MNATLKSVLVSAETLPEADQAELAHQIEEMIIARKIAASEAELAAGQGARLDDAFLRITEKLSASYGNG